MPTKPETLTDVPANKVGKIVQGCVDDGATEIECTQQPNGKWTITATYP